MNAAIAHRGPDDQGTFCDEEVSLGQVRLAILDLSPAGHQPMWYEHKGRKVAIVFNGEIYNFQDIRAELEQKGYAFKSSSDTEVMLAAYLEYGPDCVQRFNGMWAFALYDPGTKRLFCSRDRFGVKPFYYYWKNGSFIFASELKGILAHANLRLNRKENLDPDAIDYFYSLGFIPSPQTAFKDVYKLEPRQNLILDLQAKKLEKNYYFDIPAYKPESDRNALIREGRELLKDAIRLRMIADVPVGAFLSGGLDSSAVVGLMRDSTDLTKLHTFSIGFTGRYDESDYAKTAAQAFGTRHHHHYFTGEDLKKSLDLYQRHFDEPLADFGYLPSFTVSREARQHVTVALTGDGGDEVFAGYGSFANVLQYEKIRQIPAWLRRPAFALVNALKKESDWSALGKLRELLRWSLVDTPIPLKELYPGNQYLGPASRRWSEATMRTCLEKAGSLAEASRYHSLFYLSMGDNFLTKTDRATMAYALEGRSPFCDWRWAEYSARVPTHWKVNWRGGTKLIMRDIIRGIVPESILTRGKQGFTPPFVTYVEENVETIRSQIKKTLDPNLLPDRIFAALKPDSTDPIAKEALLRTYLLALWYERWVSA